MTETMHSARMAHLELLRKEELERVLPLVPGASRLLEIGAGAGWQASVFQHAGHQVEAVDLAASRLSEHASFPVRTYDGHRLPYADKSFDVIFSSNVLEHIPHIDEMHREMQRVLRPGGMAIHVLPTTAWRFWTSATHSLWVVRRLVELAGSQREPRPTASDKLSSTPKAPWRYLVWPNRHGEKGNSLTELYWFSRSAWRKQFTANKWKIESIRPVELFYTGNQVFHRHIGLNARRRLSHVLGSATCIYVLRKS